jgi:5-(carboxyamino)imidazole ribonucleotide mutase
VFDAIIAGAGGAAHLPGMVASITNLPVIGVPIKSSNLNGIDSLLSIVQMPKGVPVATVAIGDAGAENAAILAAKIIGLNNNKVNANLRSRKKKSTDKIIKSSDIGEWTK